MCTQNAFAVFWTILTSFYHLRTGPLSTDSIDCDGMDWTVISDRPRSKENFWIEYGIGIGTRVDCLHWNEIWRPSGFPLPLHFIGNAFHTPLLYLFISLGASWGKISGKATEEQQEICIVTKGERWLPSISFVLLHFAEFHMKCISIVVCWGK